MIIISKIKNNSKLTFVFVIFLVMILGVLIGYLDSSLGPLKLLAALIFFILIVFIFQKPIWGIFLVAFFLPFERIGSYDVADMTIRISQVLAIITVIGWFFIGLIKKSFFFKKNPLFFPLLFFIIINLFSLINADNLERSAAVFIYTIFTIIVSLLIPQLVTTKDQVEKIVKIIFFSALLVGIFGIFQYLGDIVGLPTSLTGLRDLYTKKVLGFPRIQSTALEPLYFANYLLIPLGLASAFFLSRGSRFRLSHLVVLLIILGTNLVLTVSRGGYLAFLALLLIVGLFYWRYLFTPKKITALLLAAALVFYLSIRFLGLGDRLNLDIFKGHVANVFYGAAYNERVETLQLALTAFRLHPLVGIGVGGFGPFSAPHSYLPPPDGWKIVNNEFVELLAEVGVLGFFSFLLVILILIFRSLKAIQKTKDKFLKAVIIGLLATFIGVIVQYQTFSILYIMHIWFLFGLMVAVQNIIMSKSDFS